MVDVVGERSTWEWMILPLKRYAEFSGRSRRKEYWLFALFLVLTIVVMMVLALLLGTASGGGGEFGGLGLGMFGILGLAYLAVIIPSIAVQVRRFHDQDKSGWFVLLNLIPYIGGLAVFVFMLLEGTKGPNNYGPDPKGQSAVDPNIFA